MGKLESRKKVRMAQCKFVLALLVENTSGLAYRRSFIFERMRPWNFYTSYVFADFTLHVFAFLFCFEYFCVCFSGARD
jgi:hypothetical protein